MNQVNECAHTFTLFDWLTHADIKDVLSTLVGALQVHRVAKKLRARESKGTVDRELASIYIRIDEQKLATVLFLPLVHAIIRKASDVEIWKQVFLLIASASRITPPPSVDASFGATPRTYSSASHEGSEQTERLLQDALRDELRGCAYVKVQGFFEKYFEGKSWSQNSKEIYESIRHMHSGDRWTTFPDIPTESTVWNWWSWLQNEHLTNVRGMFYRTTSKKDMTGLESEGQLDLFVKSCHAPSSDSHEWSNVRVIGEHTISTKSGEKFLQLARYARNVFSAQPRRKFVHGFIIFHTKLELHVFDRSGTFCSEPFDIHEEPERFICTIAGYCMMGDEELGLNTSIEREESMEFVTIADEASGEGRQLQLESWPIARQAAIVGRGTSCYRTVDSKSVVKFSWVSTSRSPTEPDLLRLARQKKVKGIPRLIGHRRAITIGEMRSSLSFAKKRQLHGRLARSEASFSSQLELLPLADEPISGRKRKSVDANPGSQKKSRSNSQVSKLSQVYEAGSFNSQSSFTSPAAEEQFVDRIFSYQATQPAGRPLSKFHSVLELLQALRDAIKIHRSLFFDGRILHRDVSEANMVITEPDENDGLSGMLIDLELGTVVEDGQNTRTGSQRMTGTLKFMAIEVVKMAFRDNQRDLEHTYRHDLESFFYVFLSVCVNYGWPAGRRPKEDPFRRWYVGSYEDIVIAKTGDMERGSFRTNLRSKFSPKFICARELAMDLRDLLFLRGDELRVGTPDGDESILYNQVVGAFDRAIESLDN